MIEKTKLFVFDIDDTLTLSAQLHQLAFVDVLHAMGVKEIDTNFGAYLHHTDSFIAQEIYEKDKGEEFTPSKIDVLDELLLQYLSQHSIKEIKGAHNCVSKLEENTEYGVCFASGSLLKAARYKLNEIGLENFETRLSASNELLDRASIVKDAIKKAKMYYGVRHFEQIIAVGDGLWDLKTAEQLKVDFIGIGKRNYDVLKANNASIVWEDFHSFNLEEIKTHFG